MLSLQLALAKRLVHIDADGKVLPLSTTEPQAGIPSSVSNLMKGSEKMGFWCGQLTSHELSSILKVRF